MNNENDDSQELSISKSAKTAESKKNVSSKPSATDKRESSASMTGKNTPLVSKAELSTTKQRKESSSKSIPGISNFKFSSSGELIESTSFEDVEGEETVEEDLELYPYGKYYEEITKKHLKEIALQLGLIKLYWPEQLTPDVERKKTSENKYHFVYKDRRPLLLAADNERGLQKMVCTTIRPTTMRFPEFKTWEGCSSFVADYLEFEPLEKPQLLVSDLFFFSYKK
ncbi:hypothetical protein L9F63_001896 [Diploptera punctata]|uniref:Uncharacterized protein n=1 Tax=Diploptera punctata TaxID=6984 RepID=A0AAD8A4D3_DIPPU|nr:hypothetical protein L9F63_001896 [Diploptera punctata]